MKNGFLVVSLVGAFFLNVIVCTSLWSSDDYECSYAKEQLEECRSELQDRYKRSTKTIREQNKRIQFLQQEIENFSDLAEEMMSTIEDLRSQNEELMDDNLRLMGH
ncbi:hypothetical protein ACFL3M_03270 [Patescibacteria group bacterium]